TSNSQATRLGAWELASWELASWKLAASAADLPRRALALPRPLVVARREVIEIGDLPARRVDELRDVGELREVDLAHFVGQVVVVAVQAGRVEDDWDPLRRVAVMVAPRVDRLRVRRIVQLVVE